MTEQKVHGDVESSVQANENGHSQVPQKRDKINTEKKQEEENLELEGAGQSHEEELRHYSLISVHSSGSIYYDKHRILFFSVVKSQLKFNIS